MGRQRPIRPFACRRLLHAELGKPWTVTVWRSGFTCPVPRFRPGSAKSSANRLCSISPKFACSARVSFCASRIWDQADCDRRWLRVALIVYERLQRWRGMSPSPTESSITPSSTTDRRVVLPAGEETVAALDVNALLLPAPAACSLVRLLRRCVTVLTIRFLPAGRNYRGGIVAALDVNALLLPAPACVFRSFAFCGGASPFDDSVPPRQGGTTREEQ